jgi:predicted XRE-type DNA-binding protein
MLATTFLALRDPSKVLPAITAAGLKPPAVAKQVGISVSRIYQLAKGQVPSLGAPAAVAFCAAVDVDVRTLFEFPDGPELVRLGLIDA